MARGPLFIAVAGNIAAGKSTLVAPLAAELALPAFAERPDENPWFERATAQPSTWSFHAELHFLLEAVQAQRALVAGRRGGVLERPAAEHVEIFGRLRHERGWLDDAELDLLHSTWHELSAGLAGTPDVLVVLHGRPPVLLQRVRDRNWPSERLLDERVLATLDRLYCDFVEHWSASPIVEVDTEEHDVRAQTGVAHVARRIEEVLST
ncbi:MAG TPA: deoxynucleoside kinase [Solirubrobacteraceae bacterium]